MPVTRKDAVAFGILSLLLTAVISGSCSTANCEPPLWAVPTVPLQTPTVASGQCEPWFGGVPQPVAVGAEALRGDVTTIPSPDGRFELIIVDDETDNPAHRVLLKVRADNALARLYEYARSAEFLWSPSGVDLALTDHGGSDFSRVVVFRLSSKPMVIDVVKQLCLAGLPHRASLQLNHHVYLKATGWASADTLTLHAHGWGDADPEGFEICLLLVLPDKASEVPCAK